MQNVSSAFKTSIEQRNRRKVFARVTIDYTDPTADESVAVLYTGKANEGYPDQIHDGIELPTYKYAALDGSWILDGTYSLMPESPTQANYIEVGYWSDRMSKSDKTFPVISNGVMPNGMLGKRLLGKSIPALSISVVFSSRAIDSLKVVGDSQRNEYPEDFVVNLYDNTGAISHTETVTGNTGYRWAKDITTVLNIARQELVIQKWCAANRHAKILEFFTAIRVVYLNSDIFSINLIEDREVQDASTPIGNISANQVTIRLSNKDRLFDAGNLASKLHNLVKPNRRVKVDFGTYGVGGAIEWVSMGTFWSVSWNVPDNDIYAEVVAQDLINRMGNAAYKSSEIIASPADVTVFDTTDTDFGAWTKSGTVVTVVSDGEITLKEVS